MASASKLCATVHAGTVVPHVNSVQTEEGQSCAPLKVHDS